MDICLQHAYAYKDPDSYRGCCQNQYGPNKTV